MYLAELVKDPGRSTARIEEINKELVSLEALIEKGEETVEQATLAENTARIAFYSTRVGMTMSDSAAQNAWFKAQGELRQATTELAYLKLRRISLPKELATLEDAMKPEQKNLWCVDYTEDLVKDAVVGTIELDEDDKWINISPAGKTTGALGKLQPVAVSTPAAVFLNLARMPCIQRWKPTYRAGRLSDINYKAQTCTVTLDNPNYSSATKIYDGGLQKKAEVGINYLTTPADPETQFVGETVLRNCPCKYMQYNMEAFVDGDYVIVEFVDRKWEKPLVIGFHNNPRPALDIMQLEIINATTNDAFAAACDTVINAANILKNFWIHWKDVFVPQYIAAVEGLAGLQLFINIQYGIIWERVIWDQEHIDQVANWWRELIGIDVYNDNKRNFHRWIAQDYINHYDRISESWAALKAVGPLLQTNMVVILTGHIWPNLDTDTTEINKATLNIQTTVVEEELIKLKNPQGTSEFSKLRNQAIEAERLWKLYASAAKYMYLMDSGNQFYAPNHGLTQKTAVIVNAGNGTLPPELTEGGTYIARVVDADHFQLRNPDDTMITFAPHQAHQGGRWRKKGCSPVLNVVFQASIYGMILARLETDVIGLVDSEGEFYIITYNPRFSSSFISITDAIFTIWMWEDGAVEPNKQALYRYPTPFAYGCLHWKIKDMGFGDVKKFKMSVSVTGRRQVVPSSLGATCGVTRGNLNTWSPWIRTEPGSFGRMLVPESVITDLAQKIPYGFYWFASKYYDHPIATGVDNHDVLMNPAAGATPAQIEVLNASKDAIVLEVNKWVNQNYTYLDDPTDYWEFMGQGRTSGDCEDFALTKIQMLLNRGFSVNDFKIQCGFPTGGNDSAIVIGHAWVLYRGSIVLDNNPDGAFRTVADMVSKYPDLCTQVRGRRWNYQGAEYEWPAELLWPYEDYSYDFFTCDLNIRKMVHSNIA